MGVEYVTSAAAAGKTKPGNTQEMSIANTTIPANRPLSELRFIEQPLSALNLSADKHKHYNDTIFFCQLQSFLYNFSIIL